MVTTQSTLDIIENEALTNVNAQVSTGFSSGTGSVGAGDTSLENEVARVEFLSKIIDIPNSKIELESELSLSQGNSETITSIGTFDELIAGNLGVIESLPVSVEKDDSFKLRIGLRVTTNVINIS